MTERKLSHLDDEGKARMVDVSGKPATARTAVATGRVLMKRETFELIRGGGVVKGDVLAVARIAGIMAAKRTGEIIPLCHPLVLTSVDLDFTAAADGTEIGIEARVSTTDRTGVEMEALTAVAAAGLTIYDMCKAVDREMTIRDIRLVEKQGGKSGTFRRDTAD